MEKTVKRRSKLFCKHSSLGLHCLNCVCSDIEIWSSGRSPAVKKNRKIEITSVDSCRVRLRKVVAFERFRNIVIWLMEGI